MKNDTELIFSEKNKIKQYSGNGRIVNQNQKYTPTTKHKRWRK